MYKPSIIVLAKVVHTNIDMETRTINVPILDQWDMKNNSNLLALIRDINHRFDSDPPLPEKMAVQKGLIAAP